MNNRGFLAVVWLVWLFVAVIYIALVLAVVSNKVEAPSKEEPFLSAEEPEDSIYEELYDRLEKQEKILREIIDILQEWDVREKEVTGYAPLDPNAVEGMCYSGDPNITASGEQVIPGVTAAATIDFGTRVLVPGRGIYVVQDRGGRIKEGQLDITFKTQREALEFGRQTISVMVEGGGE